MAHGYLTKIGDRVNINRDPVTRAIRELTAENLDTDAVIHAKVRELAAKASPRYPEFMHPSIAGSLNGRPKCPTEDLNGLLKHANQFIASMGKQRPLLSPK
ncbi:hypothetical protein ACQKWADRAFT_316522 [Trichoderma austrokoningii]